MMKRKGWIVGSILLATALSLCFFGVRLRIAPRLVLSRTLERTFETLEERFQDSPLLLLTEGIDPEGRQQLSIQLETAKKPLGVIRWDLILHTQLSPNRIRSEGTVITGGKALDIALYLDENFAAISSESLVQGNFYGITYDTFPKDLRSRPLLAALIGEKTLSEWEASVSGLDDVLSRDFRIPEFTLEDVRTALYGALAWKPQVRRIRTSSSQSGVIETVSFVATGQEIASAAEPYRNNLSTELLTMIDTWKNDTNALVNIKFLLAKGKLTEIQASFESSEAATHICVALGEDPEKDPLTLELQSKTKEHLSTICLNIETSFDDEHYQEKLVLTNTTNGIQKKVSANYLYDLSTQELDLTLALEDQTARIRLNLAEEEDSVILRTQDISPLMNLFLKKPITSPAICTMTILPGAEVTAPEYRNLDTWSAEDIFTLLEGFGLLLGIKLP